MDLKNQIELELYFADHFETVLFPVLADIYLRQEDFRRARKVCNIGLGYHENDSAGRFVLAQVEKAEGNLKEAEKELHHVIKYSPDHSAAAIMLCEIQTVFFQLVFPCHLPDYLNPGNRYLILTRLTKSLLNLY